MATYIGHENNVLKYDNGIIMDSIGLKEILGMCNYRFREFIQKLKENNIIRCKDENIYINEELFFKGSMSKIVSTKEMTRIRIETIRQLYKECPKSKLKILSYLYKLIPFTNMENNVVCKNIYEKDPNNIDFISLSDFAKILGYDEQNISRLKNDLLSIRYNGEDCICFLSGSSYSCWEIFINPFIFFAGNAENDNIKILKAHFVKTKNKKRNATTTTRKKKSKKRIV